MLLFYSIINLDPKYLYRDQIKIDPPFKNYEEEIRTAFRLLENIKIQ